MKRFLSILVLETSVKFSVFEPDSFRSMFEGYGGDLITWFQLNISAYHVENFQIYLIAYLRVRCCVRKFFGFSLKFPASRLRSRSSWSFPIVQIPTLQILLQILSNFAQVVLPILDVLFQFPIRVFFPEFWEQKLTLWDIWELGMGSKDRFRFNAWLLTLWDISSLRTPKMECFATVLPKQEIFFSVLILSVNLVNCLLCIVPISEGASRTPNRY